MYDYLGNEISDETKKMFENYYSEFIHYLSPGNNSEPGLLWLMTFDNDGKAEDSTQIIDQLENDFQVIEGWVDRNRN